MRIIRNDASIKVELITDKMKLGNFEIGYDLLENPGDDIVQEVVDWLAVNCTDNFIVTQVVGRIIAGGFVDNASAAKKGLFRLNRRRSADREWIDYRIKLSAQDNVMFSMVWIDHSS